ncbi:MFS transporter [Acidicapsa dinghuensis]|uniref:MFS transporter n=1 Tax=Acidicapsa dinghuensis TaxID=2218256 RepID=A0ABW1EEA3_9BACT|nr:MFS transporter [Acidicapsa dinghuensis]
MAFDQQDISTEVLIKDEGFSREAIVAGSEAAGAESSALTRWHIITVALLVLGYSGYYFCRSDLSVVLPLLISDLGQHGIPADVAQVRLGFIASLGVLAYAIGKFVCGSLADIFGGRNSFLAGMAGAILFTVMFALGGGFPIFTLAWMGNRLVQSSGWVGLVKVSSRWFSYSVYGTVMAVLSLSYLFGDAASREIMSELLKHGMGWRGIFFTGAALLAVLLVANLLLLRETPQERGLPAPRTNPLNVYAGKDEHPQTIAKPGLMEILKPLLASRFFWLVCLLSLGTTLLRETFNLWTPTYFVDFVGLSNADAASRSALFPLFGGVSVLLAGFLSDRLGLNGRSLVLFGGLASGAGCLFLLGRVQQHGSPWIPVALVALVGFLLLGPYSYLAGAMSMDFGGEKGSATAAGIIDGVGYLAGVMSGDTMARVTVQYGWRNAFLGLAAVCLLTAAVALVLAISQRRAAKLRAQTAV